MKKILLLTLLTLLILTGCKSKSSFSVTFDEFRIKFYDNNKQYVSIQPDANIVDMKVLTELKEVTGTGYT